MGIIDKCNVNFRPGLKGQNPSAGKKNGSTGNPRTIVPQPRGCTHDLLLLLSTPPSPHLSENCTCPTFLHFPPLESHPPHHRTGKHRPPLSTEGLENPTGLDKCAAQNKPGPFRGVLCLPPQAEQQESKTAISLNGTHGTTTERHPRVGVAAATQKTTEPIDFRLSVPLVALVSVGVCLQLQPFVVRQEQLLCTQQ